MTSRAWGVLAGAMGVVVLALAPANAEEVPVAKVKALCAAGYVGPRTAYGETKEEAANKKIMYEWTCLTLADGKAKEAFDKYVSKDFCDHSHMINAGLEPCADYAQTLSMFSRMGGMLVKGGKIEFPMAASVNGEIVTQYGAGADIWRVHDGKITDHWDGSPPVTIALTAHDQAFSDRMQRQIDTGKRIQGAGIPGATAPAAPAAPAQ